MLTRESYGLSKPIEITVDVKHWVDYLQGDSQRAMTCFRLLPNEAVRLACLKTIKEGRGLHELGPLLIDWTEMTIRDLVAVRDRDMTKRLIELYVDAVGGRARYCAGSLPVREPSKYLAKHHAGTLEAFVRLMVFLADLGLAHPAEIAPIASRYICEYLGDFSDCYSSKSMISVRKFFANVVNVLRGHYSESQWKCAERVFRFILLVGDLTYIEVLDELILLHTYDKTGPLIQEGSLSVTRKMDVALIKAANLAVLKEVWRKLSGIN